MSSLTNEVKTALIGFLARREHGAFELTQKLVAKGYEAHLVQSVLLDCQALGLQSDSRFAASFCRTRVAQGYGPLRILYELQQKKIDLALIHQTLDEIDWMASALLVWQKKNSKHPPQSWQEMQKHKQFMMYRGFTKATILACERWFEEQEQG